MKSEHMKYITVARDGRKKKYRVRVGTFDSSFTDLFTARMIRDFEARQ